MKEHIELRLFEEFANQYFLKKEGKKLGASIRLICIELSDPRLKIIENAEKTAPVFSWWTINRQYSEKDILEASWFLLSVLPLFEPPGEDCGTEYDYSNACPICGVGRKQMGPLKLRASTIPKKDVAVTIGSEVVVSDRFKEIVQDHQLTGLSFQALETRGKSKCWQPFFTSEPKYVHSKTVFGVTPFDFSEQFVDDERGEHEVYKCPNGHNLGLNIISELFFKKTGKVSDFHITNQTYGVKRGFLYPSPLMIISKRAYEVFMRESVTGLKYEVAHEVD